MPAPFTTPVAQSVPFEADRNPQVGGEAGPSQISAVNVQDAIEQANLTATPVSLGLNNTLGTSVRKARADHIHRVDNLTHSSLSPRLDQTATTLNGTLVLNKDSNFSQVITGNQTGFKAKLPDATTLKIPVDGALKFEFFNKATVPISIAYFDGSSLYQAAANVYVQATLQNNSTQNGIWIVVVTELVDLNNPDFAGVKDGFEDFMFDAYAGNGGNDNQYAFTAVPGTGSSDIDGAVPAAGNDYEGIHILSSLASATAKPLVYSFNGVNRLRLGAQPESFEIRVRIETLADITQKFECFYGLMDGTLSGNPANGIFFSYDPIYPVTPVAQVVTVTPIVTSKAPTQLFREVLNGVNYDYTYTTTKTVTTTPNSFPVATFQKNNLNPTRANNTLYTVTINGTLCSYTSDATATDTEIQAGLIAAINGSAQAPNVTASANGLSDVFVTSDILGQAFTITVSATVVLTTVTANVAIAQYTQTINGTPYTFVSDGTPTATEVVTGLKALINADGPLAVTATGTTTLILTADVVGADFTHSVSANMSTVDNTVSPTATQVVTGLKTVINADGPLPITATGTTTLILTSDIPGTAFTYADADANLTNVLTTANVVQVFYSGNWIANVINSSTLTPLNTGVPVVAGQWYRLKLVVSDDAQTVYVWLDSLFINKIETPLPLAAMKFVFKLEKFLGTANRTTSIDYITWRRTRG